MRRTCSETRSEKAERPVRGEGPEGKGPLFSDRRERVSERQRVWPREASPRASSGLLREAERSRVTVKALDIGRASSPLHDRPHLRRLDQVDPYLLIVTLLLIGYGLVMTYSVTAETRTFTGDPMQFVYRGAIWATVGLTAMVAVALFDYAWLGAFAPLLYLLMLGLLGVVLVIGTSTLGAQRSVSFGGLTFQFSEVAKVLMIIVLAKFFADREERVRSPLVVLQGLGLLAPAVFLVYRQPDL